MITPLLDTVVDRLSRQESERVVLMRYLLAQAHILGGASADLIQKSLAETAPLQERRSPSLSSALSLLWHGWANILHESNPNIPQAIYLLRASHKQLDLLHRGDYLYWAQIGHALALSRLGQSVQAQDLVDEIMTCTSFARDELAQRWMRKLLSGELATWCKNSDNVMNASYSKSGFLKECKLAAEGDTPILFTGERGAGKESTGRLIHEMKGHSPGSFLCINCETLSNSPYPFKLPLDEASGLSPDVRTLFFNHVDQLPVSAQADLMTFITKNDSGATTEAHTTTPRLFAATSADIEQLVIDGRFDRDLYNFLQINCLHVAPLRSRISDIPLLAIHYAHQFCPAGVPFVGITEEALTYMLRYDWPGNVRQLRNEIERAILFLASEPIPVIDSRVLPDAIKKQPISIEPEQPQHNGGASPLPLEEVLASTEKQVIEDVLALTHGQVSVSASHLGLTRQGLYKKIKRLGILVSNFQDDTKSNPSELLN